ncbi:MAG TPA: HAMP domain-containing sensor histidine kinase [Rhizomicrobium sp.]|jgi:signal transduction histidine kinase
MSHCHAVAGPIAAAALPRKLRGLTGHVRLTVIVCLALIFGSFVSAALIQMWLDHNRGLAQAAMFGERRAQEMALDLGAALDRYRAIGLAFAAATTNAETSAALSEVGGAALDDIAVLDASGRTMSEMRGASRVQLSAAMIATARRSPVVATSPNGRNVALLFAAGSRIVAMEIDLPHLMPPASMQDGLLASPSGRLIALGKAWTSVPGADALALGGARSVSRIIQFAGEQRLVSLQRIEGWPLAAGTSVRVEDALDAWYGALPLYFFFILGPAFTGAALAVLFVRVFERQAKAWAAVKALRTTRPDEARLLVRLADAERRATEAERAKARFVSHVSHELRTPLNAIIGFAEAIESGVYGAPGHPKYGEYAHDIGSAGRELHAKIGSVLEYAASVPVFERTNPGASSATVDAAQIARAKLEERAATARAHGVKLVVSIPEAASAHADASMLARILGHLLDNALAYTPKGGSVRFTLRNDPRNVVIDVRDTGAGFSSEEKGKVGQPFLRFSRSGSPGGMGLGLATAMGLARRMGAALDLSSVAGQGTLAELRLAAAVETTDAGG